MSDIGNDRSGKINDTEIFISKALRLGVIISAVVIGFGFILLLATGNSGYPSGTFPTSLSQVINGIASFKSYAIIAAGLLLLILTPVFRVGISIITFIKEKDSLYTIITIIVFSILIISFLLGKGE
ncbi:MAG: DUF1634 domain-containing protein [Bacillota bacterium]|nr:DUF1634 domain-containing protein [Bacillota bacterium]